MSDRVKGTVTKVGKGKFSYFIVLDDNGFYWNTKFEPKCGEGDVVGIEGTRKNEQRGQISKVKVLESNSSGYPGDAPAAPKSGGYASPAGGNRQDSIMWQSSRKDALVLAEILLSNEAFAAKGKPDAKRLQIEALVDEVTVRFFKDASDPTKCAAYTDLANAEKEDKESQDDVSSFKLPEAEDDDWDTDGDDW